MLQYRKNIRFNQISGFPKLLFIAEKIDTFIQCKLRELIIKIRAYFTIKRKPKPSFDAILHPV